MKRNKKSYITPTFSILDIKATPVLLNASGDKGADPNELDFVSTEIAPEQSLARQRSNGFWDD